MSEQHKDEFYIGYLPEAPDSLAKLIRKTVIGLLSIAAILAIALLVSQKSFYPSVFEFGVYEKFDGIIKEKPYPMILVERPGEIGQLPGYSQYYLVAFGKFGAQEAVKGLDGKRVNLEGSLIYRENQTMIEILDGSIKTVDDKPQSLANFSGNAFSGKKLGIYELTGEIVDSKCFWGVMNPGETKPHKSCAIRCISGGIPPVLLVRSPEGLSSYFLLVSNDGQMVNDQVLEMVADPVTIKGEVVQHGNLMLLKAEPVTYRSVN